MPSQEVMRERLDTLYDALTKHELEAAFSKHYGDTAAQNVLSLAWAIGDTKPGIIDFILIDADRHPKHKDMLCRILKLPTDAEQQAQVSRDAASAAKWSAGCALGALFVAFISLVLSILAFTNNG